MKKRLIQIFKVLFGMAIITLAAIVVYEFYEYKQGRDYCDRYLSDDITLRSFADNKWKVYDEQTGEYTTGKIDWLAAGSKGNSLAVYALSGKRGYIDVGTGRIVIDAEANDYSKAWVFSEGLAAVVKDNKVGFINAQNEVVLPFQFDYTDKCSMWNLSYVFHDGYCVMTNADGKIGLIDRSGNWVVEPQYDEVWVPHESGYRVVIDDNKFGVMDSTCKIVYPVEYGYIDIASDGFILTKGGRQWQVDFEGRVVNPFLFDDTYELSYVIGVDCYGDEEYELSDYVKYEVAGLYGIFNRHTGRVVSPAIYSNIEMVSKELFKVQQYDLHEWNLLDSRGNMVP